MKASFSSVTRSRRTATAALMGVVIAATVALMPGPARAQLSSPSQAGVCTSTGDPGANFARTGSNHCTIASAGPLTHIIVSPYANCQLFHRDDQSGAHYSGFPRDNGECGTFLAAKPAGSAEEPTLYGPDTIPCYYEPPPINNGCAGSAVPPDAAFQPIGQKGVFGAGTAQDPYAIVTEYQAGDLRVVQTDSYVVGTQGYRTDIQITNMAVEAYDTVLTRAADCFLQGADNGTGRYTAETGAVACVPQTGSRVLAWQPISPGSHWFQGDRATMWRYVSDKQGFPDRCVLGTSLTSLLIGDPVGDTGAVDPCTRNSENGAGINWAFTLDARETTTRSHWTTFSPYGQTSASIGDAHVSEPVSGTVDATFQVTLENPVAKSVTFNYATADNTATAPGDYQSATGELTFEPGETAKTITVPVAADATRESTEDFHVVLSKAADPLVPDPYLDPTSPLNTGLPGPPDVVIARNTGVGTVDDTRPAPPRRWPPVQL